VANIVTAVKQIDEYFEAWNEPDSDRRRDLLARSVSAGVELVHPTFGRSDGIDALSGHIASYQAALPNSRVVLTSAIDRHNQLARYAWQVVDAGGQAVIAGIDVVELADDGRLERILLFHDPPGAS
jgi:hypothetical protein